MEKYLKAIQQNVCAICVDSNESGHCKLTDKEICAVEYFLPEIVSVIHNSNTDDLQECYNRLKEIVCVNCRAQTLDGYCYLREDSNCSLDRYFSLIIETILKVDSGEI
ncbi:hypothetical protein ABRY23_08320 [Melioribacteraceae bacterium 4301-Me]|uniref:hypothetical protein n=1 Tax=Pyranulibacter aquaticus TaxID=3163344 RepID=UPI00359BB92F